MPWCPDKVPCPAGRAPALDRGNPEKVSRDLRSMPQTRRRGFLSPSETVGMKLPICIALATSARCCTPSCVQACPAESGDEHNADTRVLPSPESSRALDPPGVSDNDRDRKSTRLNSSHLGISYAVFWLEQSTSELQSLRHLVCRLLLEKKNKNKYTE